MTLARLPGLARLAAAFACGLALASTPAHAIFRAYLSLSGVDTNPCTLPLPCRLLPAALAVVDDGGEIWMLDSANYNASPVTVAKSVTILAVPGVLGSVVASGGNAINITAPAGSVTLRNLNIRPLAGNASFAGVSMTGGFRLMVQNCNIFDFSSGKGLLVATAAQASVIDSVFRDNGIGAAFEAGAFGRVSGSHASGGTVGFHAFTNVAGTATGVAVIRSTATRNGFGVLAETHANNGISRAYVSDSLLEYNSGIGTGAIVGGSVSGGFSEVVASNNRVFNNGQGVTSSGAGARGVASGNTIVNNGYGIRQEFSAVMESAGNNAVRNNSFSNTSGVVTNIGTL